MYILRTAKKWVTLATYLVLTCSMQGLYPNVSAQPVKNALKPSSYTVVLDAGHGGKDSGCSGSVSQEKDVALELTLAIGRELSTRGDIDVIYTRDADYFVPLYERTSIANQSGADLFVSIHCNASLDRSVRGSETFVMGLHTSQENLEVAKRENRSVQLEDDQSRYHAYDPDSPLGHILLAREQHDHLEESILLAANIESKLATTMSKSRGVKQAGFVVLRATTMPSVLIEAGFLTNAEDEALLTSQDVQQRLADEIALAISAALPPAAVPIVRPSTESAEALLVHQQEVTTRKIVEAPSYAVQLAAYASAPTADKLTQYEIYPDVQVITEESLYKIQAGTFSDLSIAMSYQNRLRAEGHAGAFVVQKR